MPSPNTWSRDESADSNIGIDEALQRIDEARRNGRLDVDLSGLKLITLPETLRKLTALRSLDISRNRFEDLPIWLGEFKALQSLNASVNRLISLPKSIGDLSELYTLAAYGNLLTALPETLGQLRALNSLVLYGNTIETLPESLGQLQALKLLDLSYNQFTTLPNSIGQLKSLCFFEVTNNRLLVLPDSWKHLTSLRSLDLHGNHLAVLPDALGDLTALQLLDLSVNRLSTLPDSFRELTSLKSLFLHGNAELALPDEVLGPTRDRNSTEKPAKAAKDILEYYFRIRGDAGRPLRECKLIVVGRGGAGKTSLVKRLSNQPYDPAEGETHGINIQKLIFQGKSGSVTSRVWDFGGQVVLHSMHEFFLTARSLYLLVLGERDDMLERDAAYWLQLIRSYAGDAPVVVALNKSAGRQRQFDRETLEEIYGPILGWVATECSEPDSEKGRITELRKTLTAALDSTHMDSVRRKFPAKWFSIKDALEGMKESFLDHAAYAAKCASLGEKDEREQTALAGDLHDLGVALNYGRDPRLRDTTVLRPDWLANGIYAVLRANDLDDKQLPPELNLILAPDGVVDVDIISRIHKKAEGWKMLRATDYPAPKRIFLLRLMDLFHLSYPLDEPGNRHLVPTLLPLNPPDDSEEPEGPDRIRLRYEFQVVPAPLLPWFIARTFSLIPGRKHWRRGTLLVFGEALGRVWATQDERYVYATVAGAQEDRIELLTMIRGTFNELFRDYRGLQVTEQWEDESQWVPRKTLEKYGRLEPDPQSEILESNVVTPK